MILDSTLLLCLNIVEFVCAFEGKCWMRESVTNILKCLFYRVVSEPIQRVFYHGKHKVKNEVNTFVLQESWFYGDSRVSGKFRVTFSLDIAECRDWRWYENYARTDALSNEYNRFCGNFQDSQHRIQDPKTHAKIAKAIIGWWIISLSFQLHKWYVGGT